MGGEIVNRWLHLTYKIPRSPSSPRVKVWRKLKRLGALHLHDTVWVLPHTYHTYEQFQWLVVDIKDLGGEAIMWDAKIEFGVTDEDLIERFNEQINEEYQTLLKRLLEQDRDLVDIAKKYRRIKLIDYFNSPLERKVREQIKQQRSEQD